MNSLEKPTTFCDRVYRIPVQHGNENQAEDQKDTIVRLIAEDGTEFQASLRFLSNWGRLASSFKNGLESEVGAIKIETNAHVLKKLLDFMVCYDTSVHSEKLDAWEILKQDVQGFHEIAEIYRFGDFQDIPMLCTFAQQYIRNREFIASIGEKEIEEQWKFAVTSFVGEKEAQVIPEVNYHKLVLDLLLHRSLIEKKYDQVSTLLRFFVHNFGFVEMRFWFTQTPPEEAFCLPLMTLTAQLEIKEYEQQDRADFSIALFSFYFKDIFKIEVNPQNQQGQNPQLNQVPNQNIYQLNLFALRNTLRSLLSSVQSPLQPPGMPVPLQTGLQLNASLQAQLLFQNQGIHPSLLRAQPPETNGLTEPAESTEPPQKMQRRAPQYVMTRSLPPSSSYLIFFHLFYTVANQICTEEQALRLLNLLLSKSSEEDSKGYQGIISEMQERDLLRAKGFFYTDKVNVLQYLPALFLFQKIAKKLSEKKKLDEVATFAKRVVKKFKKTAVPESFKSDFLDGIEKSVQGVVIDLLNTNSPSFERYMANLEIFALVRRELQLKNLKDVIQNENFFICNKPEVLDSKGAWVQLLEFAEKFPSDRYLCLPIVLYFIRSLATRQANEREYLAALIEKFGVELMDINAYQAFKFDLDKIEPELESEDLLARVGLRVRISQTYVRSSAVDESFHSAVLDHLESSKPDRLTNALLAVRQKTRADKSNKGQILLELRRKILSRETLGAKAAVEFACLFGSKEMNRALSQILGFLFEQKKYEELFELIEKMKECDAENLSEACAKYSANIANSYVEEGNLNKAIKVIKEHVIKNHLKSTDREEIPNYLLKLLRNLLGSKVKRALQAVTQIYEKFKEDNPKSKKMGMKEYFFAAQLLLGKGAKIVKFGRVANVHDTLTLLGGAIQLLGEDANTLPEQSFEALLSYCLKRLKAKKPIEHTIHDEKAVKLYSFLLRKCLEREKIGEAQALSTQVVPPEAGLSLLRARNRAQLEHKTELDLEGLDKVIKTINQYCGEKRDCSLDFSLISKELVHLPSEVFSQIFSSLDSDRKAILLKEYLSVLLQKSPDAFFEAIANYPVSICHALIIAAEISANHEKKFPLAEMFIASGISNSYEEELSTAEKVAGPEESEKGKEKVPLRPQRKKKTRK